MDEHEVSTQMMRHAGGGHAPRVRARQIARDRISVFWGTFFTFLCFITPVPIVHSHTSAPGNI